MAGERHDIQSQETHSGQVDQLPPAGAARGARADGRDLPATPTRRTRARSGRRTSSGSSCQLAHRSRRRARHPQATSSRPTAPGEKLTVDEYYRWIFENSVPGLPEAAAARGPGAARVHAAVRRVPDRGRRSASLQEKTVAADGAVDAIRDDGRRARGRQAGRRRWSTGRWWPASRRRRAGSRSTRARMRGLGLARAGAARVHPQPRPPRRSIDARPRRDAAAADLPPADAHPHAQREREVAERDLAPQPALDAHERRRAPGPRDRRPRARHDRDRPLREPRLGDRGRSRRASSPARTTSAAGGCTTATGAAGRPRACASTARGRLALLRQVEGVGPFESADPDSERIWWSDGGVHQNLTFPVHPDPVSGMHCWHQKRRGRRARRPSDRYGDVFVDTGAVDGGLPRVARARPAGPGPAACGGRSGWTARCVRPRRCSGRPGAAD